ncbi:TerB family tellurite resistance protein [Umboniibacter marinipuniceus]|uniref:Putative tellurite resistance protein B-like protein n=1 Tax=Umboniibacter marinipuniceus TaxID=569599 RepID=A0A3M0A7V2_9GAMM|nr:TerB family tellurite resistance protein [Umboniibacter marinipuniceus]RMA78888.1 putative tellurite resistance protein B-like protein [Umboniibacter marinipuniceus]
MFKALKALLEPTETQPTPTSRDVESASAALMIMLAIADSHFDDRERQMVVKLIKERSELDDAELNMLISEAEQAATSATSIYEFSQQLNKVLVYEDRVKVVRGMWEVAYADGVIDKYEEHLIRRVCDLMYVSHQDFIQTRNSVRDQ